MKKLTEALGCKTLKDASPSMQSSIPEPTSHHLIEISTSNTEKGREGEVITQTTPTKCDTPNSRKPDIECEICKHKFINSNNLTKHIEKYHENKENKSTNSYKCDHCSLTFK